VYPAAINCRLAAPGLGPARIANNRSTNSMVNLHGPLPLLEATIAADLEFGF
jgi:hypothetical protein